MRSLVCCLGLLVICGCQKVSPQAEGDQVRLDRIAAIYSKGDAPKSIIELEDYLSDFPQDDLAFTILGHAYNDEERLDEAQAAYKSALALNPEQFQSHTGLGIVHRKRGDYDAAMRAYETAIEINDTYAEAYSSMTMLHLKRRNHQKAVEYAKKAYDLDQTSPVIVANLAVAYHYNKDFANRDKFTSLAEQMGYANLESLALVYSGEASIYD